MLSHSSLATSDRSSKTGSGTTVRTSVWRPESKLRNHLQWAQSSSCLNQQRSIEFLASLHQLKTWPCAVEGRVVPLFPSQGTSIVHCNLFPSYLLACLLPTSSLSALLLLSPLLDFICSIFPMFIWPSCCQAHTNVIWMSLLDEYTVTG